MERWANTSQRGKVDYRVEGLLGEQPLTDVAIVEFDALGQCLLGRHEIERRHLVSRLMEMPNDIGADAARLVISRDPLGNATGLEYDSLGRVTTSVRDMNGDLSYSTATGLTGIQPATDIVTATEYLDATRALRLTDPRGFISEQQFDPLGRLTTLIQPAAERAPGTIPTVATDLVTRWEYDLLASPNQPTKITDPLGYATHFLFDDFARLETILREYASDGPTKLHAKLQYAFSPVTGLPESVTTFRSPFDDNNAALDSAAAQLTQAVIYDALDRPQQQVFAAGSDKELITQQSYTSTGIPFLKEIRESTDPLATWSAYRIECDALGRPTKQILPAVVDDLTNISAHPSTEIHYDAYGRISSTSDAYGHSTEFGYDILGRLAYEKLPAVTDARSEQISRPTTLYHYDSRGLLSKRIDPRGYAWHSDYDAAGRLTSRSGPVLRPELPESQRRPLWQYFYDTSSNLTETIDPRGHSTHSSYFPDNRLNTSTQDVTLTDANGTPTITPVSHRYQYDALGRLTRLSDGLNQATTFGYDGLGRTISATRDADDAARKKTETTEYDALLSTAHIDAANRRKEFFYDDQFRLEQLSIIGHSEENLSFDYDLRGRLTGIQPITPPADLSLGNPAISRSYDPLGRLTSETSNTVTSQYGYDLLSQLTRITDSASAATTRHSYDPAGRRSSTTTSPLITGQSALTTSFGYNLAGQLVRETLPNGLEQSNTLDPAGRITAQTLRAAGSTQSISRTEYEYDLLANVTLLRETFAPGLNIPSRTLSNSYDQRSQLISEQQQESGGQLGTTTRTRSEIHRYDAAENRLSTVREINDPQNGASTLQRSFTFGNATNGYNSNQLYQLTETLDAGAPLTSTFGYDPNGNRSSKATASLTDTYTYDSFNRLTGLELNTAAPSENGNYQYRYDPLTRRIARSTGVTPSAANTYQFAFSGSSPVHEWDGDISSTSYHQQRTGSGVGGLLQTQEADGTATHPRHNLRGDITAQFSETGTLLWHGSYASNGMLNHQYGTRNGNYGANGKYEEPAGLLNEGFRYRDRLTNNFLTRDPAGFIDGPNDYNYVRHNPWSTWDPNGLSDEIVGIPSNAGDIGYRPPWLDNNPSSAGHALAQQYGTAGIVSVSPDGRPVAVNLSPSFWFTYAIMVASGQLQQLPINTDWSNLYTPIHFSDAISVTTARGGRVREYSKTFPWASTAENSPIDLWILPHSIPTQGSGKWHYFEIDFITRSAQSGSGFWLDLIDIRAIQCGEGSTLSHPWGSMSQSESNTFRDRGYLSMWNTPLAMGSNRGGDTYDPYNYSHQIILYQPDYAIPNHPFQTLGQISEQVAIEFATAGFGEYVSNLSTVRRLAGAGTRYSIQTANKGLGVIHSRVSLFEEIDQILRSRGFTTKGTDPVTGKGSYFHSETGRKYYLDKGGVYREGTELPHVDVHRMDNGVNVETGKRKYPLGDYLIKP